MAVIIAGLVLGTFEEATFVARNFFKVGAEWVRSWSSTSVQDVTFVGSSSVITSPSHAKVHKEPRCAWVFGVHWTSALIAGLRVGVEGSSFWCRAISSLSLLISEAKASSAAFALRPLDFGGFRRLVEEGLSEEDVEEEEELRFLAFLPLFCLRGLLFEVLLEVRREVRLCPSRSW